MFSIIVPVFRTEQFLEDCLRSVAGQRWKDFECLVIDDGSPGQTNEVGELLQCETEFARLVGKDPRFQYVRQENAGQGFARNRGISLAKGKYLVFLDADDWLEAGFLETAGSVLAERPEAVWCFNHVEVHEGDQTKPFASVYRFLPQQNTLLASLVFPSWTITAVNYFFPRAWIQQQAIRYRVPRYGEDTLFVWDAYLAWHDEFGALPRLEELSDAVYAYRVFRSEDTPQTTRSSKFDQQTHQNLREYLAQRQAAFWSVGVRYGVLAWLFRARLRVYGLRRHRIALVGVFFAWLAKGLTGLSLLLAGVRRRSI